VVYNAITPPPEIDRDKARKDLGFAANDFVVFSAGRDVPWKGFALLEEVMKNLSSEDPSYKLVILKDEPRAKVLKHLRACDVFVLDSGYEGFAFILLEAGALGAPIIASAVGANSEVIQDGKNGLIVEYNVGDLLAGAIRKIRKDPDLRERFRQEARKLVQTFSEEKMINETERLLTQYARLDD
jgi:glycosyltransferase involved in cell wall biosynthesis